MKKEKKLKKDERLTRSTWCPKCKKMTKSEPEIMAWVCAECGYLKDYKI